ncbi:MAG: hypothetical protein IKS17_08860 [Firmicutes bacterium]|nr:hypothetical protein [Bacillota bacterium]
MKKRLAVIDIGSDDIKLNIYERHGDKLRSVDTLTRDLSLGEDTFLTGRITYESAEKTAQILGGFCRVIGEYNATETVAIATTAVREADNMPYIIDQLRIKTGIDIKVIDNRREKMLINKMVFASLSDEFRASSLIVHLGGGTIGLSVLTDGEITDTLTIFTSALRLSKQFESHGSIDNLYYSDVIKDYMEGYLYEIEKFLDHSPENFVLTGSNVDMIAKMCGENGTDIIHKHGFNTLYKSIKNQSPQQISEKYDIPLDNADVMLSAVIILNRLLKYTSADKIYCPDASISDAIAYTRLFPKESGLIDRRFEEFTVTSAKKISRRFMVNSAHVDIVSSTALMIFDRLKKYHGLGGEERLLLHLACILQNCGKFVNVTQHHVHSYNIINGLNIVGIDDAQRRILALISLYHNRPPRSIQGVSPSELVVIAKLCVILQIANSINKSYTKGFEKTEAAVRGSRLIITVHTYKNIELEKWSFMKCEPFFREVYGLEAELRKKGVM